jgi:predicted DsbA family dithiol-disulfide isomerase
MRSADPVRFFFDYVDPGSYLVERQLAALEATTGLQVERIPFEVTPPPAALVDPHTPAWRTFWEGARRAAAEQGVVLSDPRIVPWTRKAHELALHAREQGRFPALHAALFEAFLLEGRDLGRVDVLLDLAVRHGLDLSRTKAVLDVDRHAPDVVEARAQAERLGVRGVPTLRAGQGSLEGSHRSGTILAFLHEDAAE